VLKSSTLYVVPTWCEVKMNNAYVQMYMNLATSFDRLIIVTSYTIIIKVCDVYTAVRISHCFAIYDTAFKCYFETLLAL